MCATARRNPFSLPSCVSLGVKLEGQLCWQALLTADVTAHPTPEDFQPCLVLSDTAEDEHAGVLVVPCFAGRLVISLDGLTS